MISPIERIKILFFVKYRHHMDNDSPSMVFALEDLYRECFHGDLTNDANRYEMENGK